MSSDKSSKLTIFSNKRKQNEPPIPIIKEKSMEKKDLKPAGVFKYFEEICQVPRPSKKEEKIIVWKCIIRGSKEHTFILYGTPQLHV